MNLFYSPEAIHDLDKIQAHIDEHNPQAAAAMVSALLDCCEALPTAPEAYRLRPEIKPGLRSQSYKSYLILYMLTDTAVRIERVLHGSRNLTEVDFG